jgi:hypothetical protein
MCIGLAMLQLGNSAQNNSETIIEENCRYWFQYVWRYQGEYGEFQKDIW